MTQINQSPRPVTHIAWLEEENARLRRRNAALERAMTAGSKDYAEAFDLTHTEAAIFGLLIGGRMISKDGLFLAIYGHRPKSDELMGPQIIESHISKLRKKIKPAGIEIKMVRGLGYRLPKESIDAAKHFIAAQREEVAA